MYAPHAQYRDAATSTAGPAQLVLMVFDALLARVEAAEHALTTGAADTQHVHTLLTGAQQLVHELTVSLDHDRGGDVAANLASLYAWCTEQLVEANVHKTAAPLVGVARVVGGLREAWAVACVAGAPEVPVAG